MTEVKKTALEIARQMTKERSDSRKAVDGKLQDRVETINGSYTKIGEYDRFYLYHNDSLGTYEMIDKRHKSFPTNDEFGKMNYDFCFSDPDKMVRRFPQIHL